MASSHAVARLCAHGNGLSQELDGDAFLEGLLDFFADRWHLFYNSEAQAQEVAFGTKHDFTVIDENRFQLFMQDIEQGLFVNSMFGPSINATTGDYSVVFLTSGGLALVSSVIAWFTVERPAENQPAG